MNGAHLHLILVHFPIVLVLTGVLILLLGLFRSNLTIMHVAFSIFIAAAVCAGAAFLTGEGAEEIVEHLAGISEEQIEMHEDAADLAVWLTAALGLLSLILILIPAAKTSLVRKGSILALVLSIASALALGRTGQEGGKIKHPEAFEDAPAAASSHREK